MASPPVPSGKQKHSLLAFLSDKVLYVSKFSLRAVGKNKQERNFFVMLAFSLSFGHVKDLCRHFGTVCLNLSAFFPLLESGPS